jgi:hypothetical protein
MTANENVVRPRVSIVGMLASCRARLQHVGDPAIPGV